MIAAGTPCRVHVCGPEDAPAVVLLHSIATSAALWAAQVPIWSRRLRLLNVEFPGHGTAPPEAREPTLETLADAVCAVLDEQAVGSAAIVGLSLGGMVAQALAIRRPERVRALVLAHTSARMEPAARAAWDERIASVEASGMAGQVQSTLERWLTPAFRARAPETAAWIADMIRSTDLRGFIAAARAIQRLDHLGKLATIRVPCLVVAGRQDSAAPLAAAQAMVEKIPDATLEILESAHLGNVEQATRFTEVVAEFLGRHVGAATYVGAAPTQAGRRSG